jgi:hypothetical protein
LKTLKKVDQCRRYSCGTGSFSKGIEFVKKAVAMDETARSTG